jgi:hypothetical protein
MQITAIWDSTAGRARKARESSALGIQWTTKEAHVRVTTLNSDHHWDHCETGRQLNQTIGRAVVSSSIKRRMRCDAPPEPGLGHAV